MIYPLYLAIGFLFGATITLLIILLVGSRAMKKRIEQDLSARKPTELFPEKTEAVGQFNGTPLERMQRIKDISYEQLALAGQIDQPQKNALDGKHKNFLLSEIRKLDDEKVALIQSILDDGHDPMLTALDADGVVTEMKLSEFFAAMQGRRSDQQKSSPEPVQRDTKQIGKFTVIRGGKNSDDGTTH